MYSQATGFLPELPRGIKLPQYLGVYEGGRFYNFTIETFHVNQQAGKTNSPREHRHKVFHILLYRKGIGSFMADGMTCSCEPGLLVMMPPELPHYFSTPFKEDVFYHELTFSLKDGDNPLVIGFEGLFEKYFGVKTGSFPFLFKPNKKEQFETDRLFIELERELISFSRENMFDSLFSAGRLLEYIFRNFYLSQAEIFRKEDSRMLSARTYIERNYHRRIYLNEIASKAGLSREHFCRKFHGEFGISPVEYALKLRMAAAGKLLLYSDKSIKQIAEDLGFSDEYHFSKSFKTVTGTPPGRFRKNGA